VLKIKEMNDCCLFVVFLLKFLTAFFNVLTVNAFVTFYSSSENIIAYAVHSLQRHKNLLPFKEVHDYTYMKAVECIMPYKSWKWRSKLSTIIRKILLFFSKQQVE